MDGDKVREPGSPTTLDSAKVEFCLSEISPNRPVPLTLISALDSQKGICIEGVIGKLFSTQFLPMQPKSERSYLLKMIRKLQLSMRGNDNDS